MQASFFKANREKLLASLPQGSVAVLFAGDYIRKTADENHLFYGTRNFVYLTGIDQPKSILLLRKTGAGAEETLFLSPQNLLWERWNGALVGFDEASAMAGCQSVRPITEFDAALDVCFTRGGATQLWLDFDKLTRDEPDSDAFKLARYARGRFPHVTLQSVLPLMKNIRAIKTDCEIEAMRQAEVLTGKGIAAMMKIAKPGLYEYNLKAAFEGALMDEGVLPAFPAIISTGSNNFCIHYHEYHGKIAEGDLILNDVGARYDFMGTDVSRGWPVSGKFSDKQRILYECAYQTSEYMYSVIKPGLPHSFVDKTIKQYNANLLKEAGVIGSVDEIGTLMWHGGAHHVGFDTHDVVDVTELDRTLEPGMVFCVDIGIYHEEWGIGFRLEDNCLITETGCENLSAAIPRSIADIEAAMGR